ncbi:MAG: ribosomal-processing cysteine protease Prp [Erysipelotrichales bacterium]|nr:ribosomal-processing cysteine protease Prp [Erysipelotrichales bacterium]
MITIKREGNLITIEGHADYKNKDDIVCASVSSIMYTTVNACLKLKSTSIDYKDDGEIVTINILSDDKYTKALINNMLSLYMELTSKYPNNIKVESEE